MAVPSRKRIIIVATNRELASEHYYIRLWMAMKNLSEIHGLSRRKWIALAVACFRDADGSVEFIWPTGLPYVLKEWDIIFNDLDGRWLSLYLAGFNGCPKSHTHLYGRLRVFDAVIRLRWPNIARGIRA